METTQSEIVKITCGNQEFEFPIEAANMNITLKSMIEDGFTSDGASIPITEVEPEIMEYVIKYCTYRQAHPYTEDELKDPRSLDFFEKEGNYDREFTNLEDDIIMKLAIAANYLDNKQLVDLCCKKIAYIIKKCKTPYDIAERFNITPDPDPELKKIRDETNWTEE